MSEKIDEWILSKCTQFCHWTQRNVGLTNFFWAKTGVFLAFLSASVTMIGYWFDLGVERSSLVDCLWSCVLVLGSITYLYCINTDEDGFYNGSIFSSLSFLKQRKMRLVWLFLTAITIPLHIVAPHSLIEFLQGDLLGWGMLIFFYFIAVTPLPPGTSKVGKMLEGLKRLFQRPVSVSNLANERASPLS